MLGRWQVRRLEKQAVVFDTKGEELEELHAGAKELVFARDAAIEGSSKWCYP